MKTREQLINSGKVWHVYRDDDKEKILFEGNKTAAFKFIKDNFGMRAYRSGVVRVGKLIWENL